MGQAMLKKIVRLEVRRQLRPTGLVGKRGPARNVAIIIDAQLERSQEIDPEEIKLGMTE
jgi:hypothetical protein